MLIQADYLILDDFKSSRVDSEVDEKCVGCQKRWQGCASYKVDHPNAH